MHGDGKGNSRMNPPPSLRIFSDLPLRRKFVLMLAILATGIIALCLVTARRNHDELLRNERSALHTRVEAALALANRYADRAAAGELGEDEARCRSAHAPLR